MEQASPEQHGSLVLVEFLQVSRTGFDSLLSLPFRIKTWTFPGRRYTSCSMSWTPTTTARSRSRSISRSHLLFGLCSCVSTAFLDSICDACVCVCVCVFRQLFCSSGTIFSESASDLSISNKSGIQIYNIWLLLLLSNSLNNGKLEQGLLSFEDVPLGTMFRIHFNAQIFLIKKYLYVYSAFLHKCLIRIRKHLSSGLFTAFPIHIFSSAFLPTVFCKRPAAGLFLVFCSRCAH